jgi:hypothetical protein
MPEVSVEATANGATHSFGGSPGCTWPGDQAISVYFDAAQNDTRNLARNESTLRCDEDPILLATPTPLASVVACREGLWTPRVEQLIELAEKAPALKGLAAQPTFPRDAGALSCAIPAGGPTPGRTLSGLCGVTVKNIWSTATVSFTEDWSIGASKTARHVWHITIQRMHVIASSQSGPAPPQLWR